LLFETYLTAIPIRLPLECSMYYRRYVLCLSVYCKYFTVIFRAAVDKLTSYIVRLAVCLFCVVQL